MLLYIKSQLLVTLPIYLNLFIILKNFNLGMIHIFIFLFVRLFLTLTFLQQSNQKCTNGSAELKSKFQPKQLIFPKC